MGQPIPTPAPDHARAALNQGALTLFPPDPATSPASPSPSSRVPPPRPAVRPTALYAEHAPISESTLPSKNGFVRTRVKSQFPARIRRNANNLLRLRNSHVIIKIGFVRNKIAPLRRGGSPQAAGGDSQVRHPRRRDRRPLRISCLRFRASLRPPAAPGRPNHQSRTGHP